MNIYQEKASQVQQLLVAHKLDSWLTFVRETSTHPDPGVELTVGADVVRHSAFLFSARGDRIAIVANFDTAAVAAQGVFANVIGYDEDIQPELLAALDRIQPATIGLNYSLDDVTADGLTYGHWLKLQELLSGSPYAERLTSASSLLRALRGCKSPTELANIRRAIAITEEVVTQIESHIRVGASERDVARKIHEMFARHQVPTAWSIDSCPIVNAGPLSDFGHASPSEQVEIQQGQLVHLDLGVRYAGYCSDLQRTWYMLKDHETAAPADVIRAAATVAEAIDAAAHVLRPGVRGIEVDAAARDVVIAAGYPEFKHAVGHGLGRAVHDGGTMLGPAWPCYGAMVHHRVEVGNVFTLELSVMTDAGCYGLEEDLVVTENGCEFLSTFQRELRVIRT